VSVTLPPGFDASAVQAVAMDMDRTILPSSLTLSPATLKAVAAVKRAGIEPIIATGRMFASARPYARERDEQQQRWETREIGWLLDIQNDQQNQE